MHHPRLIGGVASLFVLLGSSAAQGEDVIPDFTHSRPKGERQILEPLPGEKPAVPKVRFGNFRPHNPIDNFILKRLQDEKIRPKKLCNDWDFARRSCLDIAGVVPTVEDLRSYFKWPEGERRQKWIELLLRQDEYANHWTIFWGDLLRERGRVRGAPANALKGMIQKSLADNQPFNAWVNRLITASGPSEEDAATGFILQDRANKETLTVSVSEAFLGIQLRCAQCHDHPFDWWTQDDFKGMAAFWNGTRARQYRNEEREGRNGNVRRIPWFEVFTRPKAARGVFLTGATSEYGRGRSALADLITRADNPYFARVTVNRIWHKMMGKGLVNPVSNFSALNPPSHPELLDWLAIEFVQSNHDLKHVIRLIAGSRTYQQQSSESLKQRASILRHNREQEEADWEDGSLFESAKLRRMTAEQLHDSILVATGHYEGGGRRYQPAIGVTYPPRPRTFLHTFGASDRETVEPRTTDGGIQQSLTLLNGNFLNDAVRFHAGHPAGRWRRTLGLSLSEMVDAMFCQVLTRRPTKKERSWALKYVGNGSSDSAWEDLQWALFNTREFQFIR